MLALDTSKGCSKCLHGSVFAQLTLSYMEHLKIYHNLPQAGNTELGETDNYMLVLHIKRSLVMSY